MIFGVLPSLPYYSAGPYREAKKDIMASNPRNLTISGVFLAFPRFFATMRFADTECRKRYHFKKTASDRI